MNRITKGVARHGAVTRVVRLIKGILMPESVSGRAAVAGALLGTLLTGGYIISSVYISGPVGYALGLLVALVAAIPGAIVAVLAYWLLRLLFSKVISAIIGLTVGLMLIMSILGHPVEFTGIVLLPVLPLLAVCAALVAQVRSSDFSRKSLRVRALYITILVSLVGVAVFGAMWYQHEGTVSHMVRWDDPGDSLPSAIPLSDPSAPGPYQVATLQYGSGSDIRRLEYGEGVSLVTGSVDVTPFLPQVSAFRLGLRESYWGFDLAHAPLNGRVWYPAADGHFPLVLIVHGNHEMMDFSDPGYAYLGELLASRGYIVVSIDQNFLNVSAFAGDFGGQGNAARAWLVLQHLKTWQQWQGDIANPFYGKVDLNGISLIGHSRGGEAIAVAAAFNQLPYYPDDANIEFDFNFDIRSLVAIAPTDEAYTPAGRSVPLADVNYLLLHGAHDGDVAVFMGNRQYQRTHLADDEYMFKSVVYIYEANHGQFNTEWGRRDFPPPFGKLLNVKPLMPEEDQRQIARVYISAFLDSTVKKELGYLPLFQDYRAGTSWLPETIIRNRFQDSTFRAVSNFEEDLNLASTTVAGGTQQGLNFTEWKESMLSLRLESMKQSNNVAMLSWDRKERPGVPTYVIQLPPTMAANWQLDAQDSLAFSLADLGQGKYPCMDVTVYVETTDGASASVVLSDFAAVIPPLQIQFTRLGFIERMIVNPVEPVLQSYQLPISAFIQVNSHIDPTKLKEIRFLFDQSVKGQIALDDIGFQRG